MVGYYSKCGWCLKCDTKQKSKEFLVWINSKLFKKKFILVNIICFGVHNFVCGRSKFCQLTMWNAFVKIVGHIQMQNKN
jgi:hypothetical protein